MFPAPTLTRNKIKSNKSEKVTRTVQQLITMAAHYYPFLTARAGDGLVWSRQKDCAHRTPVISLYSETQEIFIKSLTTQT